MKLFIYLNCLLRFPQEGRPMGTTEAPVLKPAGSRSVRQRPSNFAGISCIFCCWESSCLMAPLYHLWPTTEFPCLWAALGSQPAWWGCRSRPTSDLGSTSSCPRFSQKCPAAWAPPARLSFLCSRAVIGPASKSEVSLPAPFPRIRPLAFTDTRHNKFLHIEKTQRNCNYYITDEYTTS